MYYHKLGSLPKKRHVVFKKEDGTLYREVLMGLEGFSGVSSLLYKNSMPTVTKSIQRLNSSQNLKPDSNCDLEQDKLTYRHFLTDKIESSQQLWESRAPLMFNDDLMITVSTDPMSDFFCNASHFELYYIESGRAKLKSEFGILSVERGDYVVIPKGIIYQWEWQKINNGNIRYLLVQSKDPIRFPNRYLNKMGQFIEDTPICERDIKVPDRLDPIFDNKDYKMILFRNNHYFERIVDHHPFDTVGWDGYLYPYAISIFDFEPTVGSIHRPPPVHQMFETNSFVVCNFVPRPYDFHQDAIPAPYFHSNIDSDEVLFYCDGNFMSRKGISRGSITLHPAGLAHGPQPGKTEESVGKKSTNELAVMIDTFRPLRVSAKALKIEQEDYYKSWLE